MTDELATGSNYLKQSAVAYFSGIFQKPSIKVGVPLDTKLAWVPTFYFSINDHITVACEVSELPYPIILELRRKDIEDILSPISVYVVCPEEQYLKKQEDAKRLMLHGFGLLTIDKDGGAQLRAECIPLVQQISETAFRSEIRVLPISLRRRLAETFHRYRSSAPGGIADLTEVVEGLVSKAGADAAKKGWIAKADVKPGYPARTIDALIDSGKVRTANAALGGVRSYIKEYRIPSHHFPKNKKQAHIKYRDCKHGFIEGLKKVCQFYDAMKALGLSGRLPS